MNSLKKSNLPFTMRKALAEIVAAVIPHKMTRNQWRGKLRYGLIRALKLRRKVHLNRDIPYKFNLAVCAIAKNEGRYFNEWIEWYRRMGVEKFYIYDNESSDNTKEVLLPYIESGLVDYVYRPGAKQQLPVYDDCIERHRFEARWIAFLDLDEFIVPRKDDTITQFLSRFEDASAVEINWLIYGSGGAKERIEGKVMDRFKRHSKPHHILNRHVKSIVNPRKVLCFIGCHEAARMHGKAYDSHGNVIRNSFRDREPQQDVIRINHYAVKSYEEFLEKRARGRARTLSMRNLDYFDRFDLNDLSEHSQ